MIDQRGDDSLHVDHDTAMLLIAVLLRRLQVAERADRINITDQALHEIDRGWRLTAYRDVMRNVVWMSLRPPVEVIDPDPEPERYPGVTGGVGDEQSLGEAARDLAIRLDLDVFSRGCGCGARAGEPCWSGPYRLRDVVHGLRYVALVSAHDDEVAHTEWEAEHR